MNFQLAREIYGLTPFCVDSFTLPAMLAILSDIKNGVKFDAVGSLKNDCFDIVFNSEDRLIRRTYELDLRLLTGMSQSKTDTIYRTQFKDKFKTVDLVRYKTPLWMWLTIISLVLVIILLLRFR
jgi:hypothetical protein